MAPSTFNLILTCIGTSIATCAILGFFLQRTWRLRIQALEQDVKRFSETICQMAEIQGKIYQRVSKNLGDIEERILDLAVPTRDPSLPLERRHHVLTLARKGMTLDEIVQRLNVPKGEAELILNLSRYLDARPQRGARTDREARRHAQA